MATMKNIDHWRTKVREAQHALDAAYQRDLPAGTRVVYIHGSHEIVVRIDQQTSGNYWWVVNERTGRRYLLPIERIHRVVA